MPILMAEEGRRLALSAGAAGAAHAMDKIFCHLRQVIVDDVRNVIHVNAAGSHVGSDKQPRASALEIRQRRGALRLRAVAMDHAGRPSPALQLLRQPLRAALGAREHQRAAAFARQQPLQQC